MSSTFVNSMSNPTAVADKSVPPRTQLTAPFWEAGLRGELLLQFDPQARRYQFYPRPVSLYSTADVEWRVASGLGRVLAASEHVAAAGPGYAAGLPYTMVLVELDEGPRMLAELKGAPPGTVQPGLRVRVAWEAREPGTAIYHFVLKGT